MTHFPNESTLLIQNQFSDLSISPLSGSLSESGSFDLIDEQYHYNSKHINKENLNPESINSYQNIKLQKSIPNQKVRRRKIRNNFASQFYDTFLSPYLGTFTGTFVPSLLQFLGVVYWIRLPRLVGFGGILGTLIAFCLTYFIIFITISSFAALISNEKIPHGPRGVYHIMSRASGAVVGGTIGILMFIANLMSAMYFVIGFGSVFKDFLINMFSWQGTKWHQYAFDSAAWFLVCIITLLGKRIFTKALVFVFLALIVSICILIYSFFVNYNQAEGITGLSWETFMNNLSWKFTSSFPMTSLISLTLPSSVAVVAGVNLSGDLKTPYPSYHLGTFTSYIWTFLLYTMTILFLGSTMARELLQNESHLMARVPKDNLQVFVITSMFLITISSCIISLIGSARVLFSMSNDGYFKPILFPFKTRVKFISEPIVGICFVYLVVQLLLTVYASMEFTQMDEDILILGRFVSTINLLAFACTNLTVVLLDRAGAPNFRPMFRYYYWPISLIGFFACIVIVFIVNTYYAILAVVLMIVLFICLAILAPKGKDWGNLIQAVFYHSVRKYLLLLEEGNIKYWRLQLLLIVDENDNNDNIMKLGNFLKKGGLYVIGFSLRGSFLDKAKFIQNEKERLQNKFRKEHLKAFSQVTVAPDKRSGIQQLILMSGLGHMKPNTVMLALQTENKNDTTVFEFAQSLCDIVNLGMNLIVHHGINHPYWKSPKIKFSIGYPLWKIDKKKYLDIYPLRHSRLSDTTELDSTISFIIQAAAILTKSHYPWNFVQLRICSIIDNHKNIGAEKVYLKKLLHICRIPECEIKIVVVDQSKYVDHAPSSPKSLCKLFKTKSLKMFSNYSLRGMCKFVNSVVRDNSQETCLVLLPLPVPPIEFNEGQEIEYINALKEMSEGFGINGTGLIMVHGSQTVISTVLS